MKKITKNYFTISSKTHFQHGKVTLKKMNQLLFQLLVNYGLNFLDHGKYIALILLMIYKNLVKSLSN